MSSTTVSKNKLDSLEAVIASLPPDSFVARYVKNQDMLETSLVYDFWCAMFCLSNAATRWCVVDRPRAPVRLNLYIILTAESGVTRKSTAVGTAARIMEAFNDRIDGRITIINTKTTPERLEQVLSQSSQRHNDSHFSFVVSELVTALGSERYNLAMPGLLTDLFDSPAVRRTTGTVSGGSQELRNVYGTFLSASTPSWLTRAINPDVIEGGFTSRVFFVISDAPKQRVSWPQRRDDEGERKLVEQLVGIYNDLRPTAFEQRNTGGERRFVLTEGAHQIFDQWYRSREMGVDPFSASFDAREDGHVLKTAALFAVNRNSGYIDIDDIHSALTIIDKTVKQKSVELLSYQVNNVLIDLIEKTRTVLLQNPSGVKHSDMIRRLQTLAKAKRIVVVLDVMHTLNMVRKFEYSHPGSGRPGVMWSATASLKSADFLQVMLENLEGTT